jgi:hypothetical protein
VKVVEKRMVRIYGEVEEKEGGLGGERYLKGEGVDMWTVHPRWRESR